MMNDDFIKRHRQQPDAKFVERLYHKINSTPTPQRSPLMFKRLMRPALLVSVAIILAAALTFAFTPSVRAAVQAILTFNGVTVSIDDATGKLVITGNPDAIVEQSDHEVQIKGDNGDMALVGVAQIDGELLKVSDLPTLYPDLVLPTVPEGYILQEQFQVTGNGSLLFTWIDAAGHMISYQRSTTPVQVLIPQGSASASTSDTTIVQEVGTNDGTLEPPAGSLVAIGDSTELAPSVSYSWEAGGYYHMLFASDSSLTEADLQAMKP
jgi:hypothetical protein